MGGFEPPTFCSQSRRANQTALHPGRVVDPVARKWQLPDKKMVGGRGLEPMTSAV